MASVQAIPDFEVLKEPRGLLRAVQWLFAVLAFSTACHYSTVLTLKPTCTAKGSDQTPPDPITLPISYPFRLDTDRQTWKYREMCGLKDVQKDGGSLYDLKFPGNFSSDAEFFVFTGVFAWLYCFLSLAVYVFFNHLYIDQQKNYPKVDFVLTALLGMFWLAGSAAWANGLNGLKNVCARLPNSYVLCLREEVDCTSSCSQFTEANISVLLGFLNCFLWTTNLWFLYKETKWFTGGGQVSGGQAANVETGEAENSS